jgi:hypothetical protein
LRGQPGFFTRVPVLIPEGNSSRRRENADKEAGSQQGGGRLVTSAAQLNQRRLPKRWLSELTDIATATQAAGVVAAHSGTYLAILIDANGGQHHAQVAACRKNLIELGLLQKCGLQLEIRWVSQKHPLHRHSPTQRVQRFVPGCARQ